MEPDGELTTQVVNLGKPHLNNLVFVVELKFWIGRNLERLLFTKSYMIRMEIKKEEGYLFKERDPT